MNQQTTRKVRGWIVVCEDDVIRHPAMFTWAHEAVEFADQGHCCTNAHQIVPVPVRIVR